MKLLTGLKEISLLDEKSTENKMSYCLQKILEAFFSLLFAF